MAMASTESIQEMLEPKYGVLAQVNRVLAQQHTYELLENNLWLLANITGDCHELCNLVMQETKLLESLDWISQTEIMLTIDSALADVVTWLLENISKFCLNLDLDTDNVSTNMRDWPVITPNVSLLIERSTLGDKCADLGSRKVGSDCFLVVR